MSGFLNPPSTSGGGMITGQLRLTGIVSPSALALGNTDNYAPAGIATASILRITCNAGGSTLTGISAQPAGTVIFLCVVAGGDLTLQDEGASSLAANRFAMPGDYVIPLEVSTGVWYDGLSLRWRLLSS